MFQRFVRKSRTGRRPFEAFQVEISTYCSLDCQMCPRTFFADQWVFQNMSLETFRRISQYFHLTKWVHLLGWGEPMENENLIHMLHLAKQANCLTGFVTNATYLSQNISKQLVVGGLDLIVVAVRLAAKPNSEKVGIAHDFSGILDRVETLIDLRRRLNGGKPVVRVCFPMTRMNIRELPSMVLLATQLGVDEVVVTNIDYLGAERCNILRTFDHESPTKAFQDYIDEIHRLGKNAGVTVRTYPLKAEQVLVCEANPAKNVFFSVDGSVAPCMYLRIPKQGRIPRIFLNREYLVPQTFFGNINSEDFLEVWNKDSYQEFRKIFEDRMKMKFNLVWNLDAVSKMAFSNREEKSSQEPPRLHEVCQTCYKAYGI